MILSPGLQRNPFRFSITPPALVVSDVYFPLASAPAAFWDLCRSDGGDIRVLKQDGVTPVPFQIVGFDAVGKVGSLFAKVDSATAFWVYFGNRAYTALAANATYGSYNVWESAAALVMHGNDLNDSTVNQNNGTSTAAPAVVAGKVGSGLDFDGSTNYIDCGNGASVQITANMTMLWWSKATDYVSFRNCFTKTKASPANAAPYDFYLNSTTGAPNFMRGNGTLYANYAAGSGPTANAFRHVGVTMSGTTVQHYYSGATNGASGTLSTTIGDLGTNLRIGYRIDGVVKMKGVLNEMRLYSRALSGAEIAQHYANQNDPAGFWTIGAALEQV